MNRIVTIGILVLGLSLQIQAQTIDTNRGPMEIFGLKNWTTKMIEDTMRHVAPDQPMEACAAVMKEKLGFPETSVIGYADQNKSYWYSILVEPQRSALVQPLVLDFQRKDEIREAYKPFLNLYNKSFRDHQVAMGTYGKWRNGLIKVAEELVTKRNASIETVRSVWNELAKFSSKKELHLAIDILNKDDNAVNRMVALAVLMNFPREDLAWHQVVRSQLDRDKLGYVSTMSLSVSAVFSNDYEMKIDWAPIKDEIRRLVNGSHANVFMTTLKLLNKGKIDGELVRYALQDGGHIVTSLLNSSHKELSEPAHKFLLRASKKDHGETSEAWERWIKSELVKGD